MRRLFVALAVAALPASAQASATGWIAEALGARLTRSCGAEAAAIEGTLSRLSSLDLPTDGKVLVVNIPAGIVTAYEDGVPVIESRAVVGKDGTPTPEMSTAVTYVRVNPTWTVPESIIERNGWRQRLADDPGFFEDNGFDVEWRGRLVSPWEASADPWAAGWFVQRPGPGNALGLVKIGLAESDGIYLHDTNEPTRFGADLRAASAGCVRVEEIREVAAWILDTDRWTVDSMVDAGQMTDHRPPRPVRVVLGYWTAWPDAAGEVRYYPDIYGLDGPPASCRPGAYTGSGTEAWPTAVSGFGSGSAWDTWPAAGGAADGAWTESLGR